MFLSRLQTVQRWVLSATAPRLMSPSAHRMGNRMAPRLGPLAVGVATTAAAAHSVAFAAPAGLSLDVLRKQDSTTSSAVIEAFADSSEFIEVAEKETAAILKRDEEDDHQLAKGIAVAVAKGVIPKDVTVEKVTKVDVIGKSADAVAKEIIAALGPATNEGCVMTLEGLSGTGKGTTVARLKAMLPNATTWSNGNIFRSLTLLAVTYSEQNNVPVSEVLTPKNLDSFVKMLDFGKYNGKFDVMIDGLGHKALVSEIQNTTLKAAKVGKNIPEVAGVTQGEVINFVKGALDQMTADGISVLLEGRAQTLNYIRTPHRFELVLSDELLIGKRRAAQKMMAAANKEVKAGDSDAAVMEASKKALAAVLAEHQH